MHQVLEFDFLSSLSLFSLFFRSRFQVLLRICAIVWGEGSSCSIGSCTEIIYFIWHDVRKSVFAHLVLSCLPFPLHLNCVERQPKSYVKQGWHFVFRSVHAAVVAQLRLHGNNFYFDVCACVQRRFCLSSGSSVVFPPLRLLALRPHIIMVRTQNFPLSLSLALIALFCSLSEFKAGNLMEYKTKHQNHSLFQHRKE